MTKERTPSAKSVVTINPAGLSVDKQRKLPAEFFTPDMIELLAMHKFCRPAYSETEKRFCEHYLGGMPGVTCDPVGNWVGRINKPDGTPSTVLWSSHTDTVHRKEGMQLLTISGTKLKLHKKEKTATCLGADCTVGVWLMRRMFLAGIPGLYIWHASEETGGNGSDYIATKRKELLDGIQVAIAFDRRGMNSVITHQGGRRTASNEFAVALAKALGTQYELDAGGTFTDTAQYAKIIPECTNVSVGYDGAHTASEKTDLLHAKDLLTALLKMDAEALPVDRDPTKTEYRTYGTHYYGDHHGGVYQGSFGGRGRGFGGWYEGDLFYGASRHAADASKDAGNPYGRIENPAADKAHPAPKKPVTPLVAGPSARTPKYSYSDEVRDAILDAMASRIAKDPWKVARMLYSHGWTLADLMARLH